MWKGFKIRKTLFIRELTVINKIQLRYVKSFTLKKYWYKNIFFNKDKLFQFLMVISGSFIIVIIYQIIFFIIYTIDLYITFLLRFFWITIVFILEQWETLMYQNIHIYRRDVVLSKRYRKEYAVYAASCIKFFTKWIKYINKDLRNSLQFSVRNYSVFIKYSKYFYVLFESIFNWFITSIKYYIPLWWLQFNTWLLSVVILAYGIHMFLSIIYYIMYIIYIFFSIIQAIYYFIYNILYSIYTYLVFKYKLYKKIYTIKKVTDKEIYNYLYINYYKYYKRLTTFESYFYKEFFSDKEIDDVIINNIIFKWINFKFLYYWHKYIFIIPYFVFLQNTYDVNIKEGNIFLLLTARDLKPFRMRNWPFLLSYISKWCVYLSPYFDKYYVIVNFYIRKYTNIVLYYLYVIIRFIIALPKFLIVYPYIPLKENIDFIIKFFKIFFNK